MKSFCKDVLKRLAVSTVSTALFAILSILIFSFVLSTLFNKQKIVVENGSFLVLDLRMNLTDRPGGFQVEDLTRQALTDRAAPPTFHLLEVLQALKKAARDKKIAGVFIQGGFAPSGYGCGYGSILELIEGLRSFKESGKSVIGFCQSPSQLDYLVYSVCSELHMDPSGTLVLNGLAQEQTFLGETLEKYGVGIQVVRVGEFKGAVEPFTSTGFSEENRLQIHRLLQARWANYLDNIFTNRPLAVTLSDLNASLDEGFILVPSYAEKVGLVDEVSSYDLILDRLSEVGTLDEESKEYSRVSLLNYIDRPTSSVEKESKNNNGIPKVAVLYVEGAIVDGWVDDGLSAGGDLISKRIRDIRKDSRYKALILRVNSPGGSVSGSDVILSEIRRAKRDGLPVVVSMGAVAASGGYWIASECDRLFAGGQSITGSIGVFGILPNVEELGARFGIHWDVVKTMDSSDFMGISRPKTENELKVVQGYVDGIYERFIGLVANSRSLEVSKVEEIAQGRVWVGRDALELGLIDELGGIERAIEYGAEISGLSNGFEVVEFPATSSPMEVLSEAFNFSSLQLSSSAELRSVSAFERLYGRLQLLLHKLSILNDPRHAYGFLPWYSGSFGF